MDTAEDIHTAGVTIQLKDGRNVYANVSPELLNQGDAKHQYGRTEYFSLCDYGSDRRP